MELKGFFKERIQIFVDEISSYKRYKNRICSICGKYIKKGTGLISYSSFNIVHEECLNKGDRK